MSKPITLVIPAGGAGLRLDANKPKQFLEHKGLQTLEWTLKAFEPIKERLKHVVIALPEAFLGKVNLKHNLPHLSYTAGGATRQQSVHNGLIYLEQQGELNLTHCLIHDAARPLLHRQDLTNLIKHLDNNHSPALLAIPVKDTLKKSNREHTIEQTVSREHLWQAQTPQAGPGKVLLEVHQQAQKEGWTVTDDASILEQAGHPVTLIESQHHNFKITTPQDWELFKHLI